MFYDFPINTIKNTAYENRKRTFLHLAKGTIVQVSLLFPSGSVGLLYLRIFRGGLQLYPFNPDGYFQTAGEVINFIDEYEMENEPYDLVAETWNLDETYDHVVHIRFNVSAAIGVDIEALRKKLLEESLLEMFL